MEKETGKENPQNNQTDGQDNPETVDVSNETDAAALQEKLNELSEKNKQLFARAKQAEGFEFNDDSKRWVKKEKSPKEDKVEVAPEAKTGDSDIESLVLEVKGITADDEIDLFQKWKKDTNRDTRSILNNNIFQSELKALRDKKAQEEATPSARRTSQAGNDRVDLLVAEYERTKKLPEDFDLRAKVMEELVRKNSQNTPPWRK